MTKLLSLLMRLNSAWPLTLSPTGPSSKQREWGLDKWTVTWVEN